MINGLYIEGYEWNTDNKITTPITLFIGPTFESELKLKLLNLKFETEISGKAGVQISGNVNVVKNLNGVLHECKKCIEGNVGFVAEGSISTDLPMLLDFSSSSKLSIKISDFHYSFDYSEWQWKSCPHRKYLVKLKVKKQEDVLVARAIIKNAITGEELGATDAKGLVEFYLPKGKNKINIIKNEIFMVEDIEIKEEPINKTIELKNTDETEGFCGEGGGENATWKYYDKTKTIVISGTGAMNDYPSAWSDEGLSLHGDTPWSNLDINTVIVEEGITKIRS